MINRSKYIKIKVVGHSPEDKWVFKPEDQTLDGGLVLDRKLATNFDEPTAFEIRKKLIPQLPKEAKVTFDLEKI